MESEMSEINARWKRDHQELRNTAVFLAAISVPLWLVSYQASFPIYTMPQWQWFAAVSIATLLAAIGCTIGAAVLVGAMIVHAKPLEGSNG
jgi:hypothetical protein